LTHKQTGHFVVDFHVKVYYNNIGGIDGCRISGVVATLYAFGRSCAKGLFGAGATSAAWTADKPYERESHRRTDERHRGTTIVIGFTTGDEGGT
jgi:hypothetical protein